MNVGLDERFASKKIEELERKRVAGIEQIRAGFPDEFWAAPEGKEVLRGTLVYFVQNYIQASIKVAYHYAFEQVKDNLRREDKELEMRGKSIEDIILDEKIDPLEEFNKKIAPTAILSESANARRQAAKKLIRSGGYKSKLRLSAAPALLGPG